MFLPDSSGEEHCLYDLFLFHFLGEDEFYSYVPIELTLIFAAHCYSLSNTGRRLRYPAWADMHYPSAGGIEVRQLYFAATRISLVWTSNLLAG